MFRDRKRVLMRNYFTFGQYDSRDFEIYISGSGTYNSPKRVYNTYTVPGRNGDLIGKSDRLENVSLTYPAFSYANFDRNIAALRSALLSTRGYARLWDSYHPDEFRMAYFAGPLTVKARDQLDAGEYDLKFDCKPQRFLTSGETVATYPPGIGMSKNLIPYPYYQTTRTTNGITFTDNGDGTITANGTATANANFTIVDRVTSGYTLPIEEYIMSGCPNGGGSSKYGLFAARTVNGASTPYGWDYGNGLSFDVTDGTAPTGIIIRIVSGATVSNLTFKPMIRLASDTDDTWVPYYDGSTQIYNPTLFPSKPLIRVYGYGTLTIGSDVITIASTGNPYTDIDSEIMDCFYGTTNVNNKVTFQSNDFPELRPGLTGIAYSGNITKVEITPRWYIV